MNRAAIEQRIAAIQAARAAREIRAAIGCVALVVLAGIALFYVATNY